MHAPTKPTVPCGVLIVISTLLAACSSPSATDIPRIDEKTYVVSPANMTVHIGVLTGELTQLTVLQRVNAKTGEAVYAPQLRGTLTLENTSSDQAVRLVNGEVQYLDANGQRIALEPDRGDARLRISGYPSERLDPGMKTTHSMDVPFPVSGLKDKAVAEMRLNLTYIPAPYREVSIDIPVALAVRH